MTTLASPLNLMKRSKWPYPALLPHSVKAYPIVQTAPQIEPPTAANWPRDLTDELRQWRSQTDQGNESYNQVYLHVPFCPFLCHFCPLYKLNSPGSQHGETKKKFVRALVREIRMYAQREDVRNTTYHSVYFGGGTPTELSPEQLTTILDVLREELTIASDAEITLEGVARQMLQPSYLEKCFQSGFNRVSFGVQSLDEEIRKLIGRGDKVSDYIGVVELARSLDPSIPVNMEIMAGMPGQSLDSLRRDVEAILDWRPASLDVLYYVMMPGTKLVQHVENSKKPSPQYGQELLQMRQYVNRALPEAGYEQVTAEAFSRSDRDLFAKASFGGGGNCFNSLLALGPSAFGFLNGTKYHNVCNLQKYMQWIDEEKFPVHRAQTVTPAVAATRALMMSIVRMEIPKKLAEWNDGVRRQLKKWKRRGLIVDQGEAYRLTEKGALWYNHMQMEALPLADRRGALRMFGSIEQHQKVARRKFDQLEGYEKEMVLQLRSHGPLQFWLYRLFLALHKLPLFDTRAIGFTGPVEA